MTSGRVAALARVDAIQRVGGFENAKAYQDFRKLVNGAFAAFHVASAKLGEADYNGLRPEFIACRRWGHQWPTMGWHLIGFNIGGGYGATYENTCECCRMVAKRYRATNGRSNGVIYDQPEGYALKGLLERFTRSDVAAIEFIGELLCLITEKERQCGVVRLHAVS